MIHDTTIFDYSGKTAYRIVVFFVIRYRGTFRRNIQNDKIHIGKF